MPLQFVQFVIIEAVLIGTDVDCYLFLLYFIAIGHCQHAMYHCEGSLRVILKGQCDNAVDSSMRRSHPFHREQENTPFSFCLSFLVTTERYEDSTTATKSGHDRSHEQWRQHKEIGQGQCLHLLTHWRRRRKAQGDRGV